MNRIFMFICALLLSAGVAADYSSSLDHNGCWDGNDHYGASCMYQISGELRNGRAVVKYGNKCNHRIYAKMCNQRNDGRWDCGASGILPGNSKNWNTYNASGHTSYFAIGSTNPYKDWICTVRVTNWHDK